MDFQEVDQSFKLLSCYIINYVIIDLVLGSIIKTMPDKGKVKTMRQPY